MTEADGAGTRRVLHLIDSLGLGGAQVILKSYMESRSDDDAIHLCSLRRAPNPIVIAHCNVVVSASPSRFSPGPLLELRRVVSRNRIGVLHCHLFRAQVFGLALKLLFFPRIMLIFHEHGRVVGRESESRLEAWAFRMFLRLATSHVDRFVCISDLTREALLAIVGDVGDRAVVVHNPIRSPSLSNQMDSFAMRRQLGVADGVFVVGFAARLVVRKGWQEFLDAVKRVGEVVPTFFLLAGDGGDRNKVAAHIHALRLQSNGYSLGYVNDMSGFYPALDCFVSPPHWEPHGLAHLEAQSYGVPIVVSDVPGLNGTVHAEVDALLAQPHDAPGLAKQILRIAQHPELRRRLADRGRANAAGYTIDNFAKALERVYSDTIHAGAQSSGAHSPGSNPSSASRRSSF